MKKIYSSLLLLASTLILNQNIFADVWGDIMEGVNAIARKSKLPVPSFPTKSKPAEKPSETLGLSSEHVAKLIANAKTKAAESANLSRAAIKNIALHLNNVKKIDSVVDYLNNIIENRGNSIAQVDEAKKLLQEILSESKQLAKNSIEATKELERTLRKTIRLGQHLRGEAGNILPPTIAKIWDTLKGTAEKTTTPTR